MFSLDCPNVVGECSEDVEAGFALVLMLSVCGLNDTPLSYVGRVGVGYGCVVQCYCRLCILFAGPGCD